MFKYFVLLFFTVFYVNSCFAEIGRFGGLIRMTMVEDCKNTFENDFKNNLDIKNLNNSQKESFIEKYCDCKGDFITEHTTDNEFIELNKTSNIDSVKVILNKKVTKKQETLCFSEALNLASEIR